MTEIQHSYYASDPAYEVCKEQFQPTTFSYGTFDCYLQTSLLTSTPITIPSVQLPCYVVDIYDVQFQNGILYFRMRPNVGWHRDYALMLTNALQNAISTLDTTHVKLYVDLLKKHYDILDQVDEMAIYPYYVQKITPSFFTPSYDIWFVPP